MVEQKETKQITIDIKRAIPIFSDNVIVANLIRAAKEEKKPGKKEGHITLIFVDTLSQQAVARIVVSRQVAEALEKSLAESIDKFDKEMKSKSTLKKPKIEATKTRGYLG